MTDSAGSVTAAALRDRLAAGDPVTLLDVRNRDEVDRWRIEAPSITHHHVPYMQFVAAGATGGVADLVPADAREPVVVVCPRGEASAEVAGHLAAAGIDAENLAGGMHAWARLLDRVVVADAGDATVFQYRRPASGCLGYAVVAGGEMAVIDPLRAVVDRYRADAADLDATITYAVDTHVHADHVSGVRALSAATDATPVLSSTAVGRGVVGTFDMVRDGDTLDVGGAGVTAVSLPGHTTGMTGFLIGEGPRPDGRPAADSVLLTGDSLFLDGVARPDLQEDADPAAQARDLYATLTERLAAFDDDALVAPGHTDAGVGDDPDAPVVARLGDLRARLPVFGMDESTFVDRVTRAGAEPANAARIAAINRGVETVDDATAFELELGPNNCAAGGA